MSVSTLLSASISPATDAAVTIALTLPATLRLPPNEMGGVRVFEISAKAGHVVPEARFLLRCVVN